MTAFKKFDLRYIIPPVLVIIAGLVRNASSGFPLFLMLPVTVCIALYSGVYMSLFCGILAGVFIDSVSALHDGIFTLILAVTAVLVYYLSENILRKKLSTALLLSGSGLVLYSLGMAIISSGGFVGIFLRMLIYSAISFAFTPLFYLIIKAGDKRA